MQKYFFFGYKAPQIFCWRHLSYANRGVETYYLETYTLNQFKVFLSHSIKYLRTYIR